MWSKIDKVVRSIGAQAPPKTAALVMSGGGARASYQAGVLQYISEHMSLDCIEIITGVSAGSINAALMANNTRDYKDAVSDLSKCWSELESEDVYEAASSLSVMMSLLRSSKSDEQEFLPRAGLVDTAPLTGYLRRIMRTPDGRLSGIEKNVRSGRLRACAIVGTEYSTGRTVTWVEGGAIEGWERPNRISLHTHLTTDHVMASTSLPFLFPAVQVNDAWYGDGGIRLAEPLSPAVHLGANRILAISTRYGRSFAEASVPVTSGYPPAAQIFGVLLNAIFLDRLDQDAATLERINDLILNLAPRKRKGLRPIELIVIRPSEDLGKLSSDFQHDLKGVLKMISRSLGSKDTKSPDWLSMILFDPRYTSRLIELGYADARNRREDLLRFFRA